MKAAANQLHTGGEEWKASRMSKWMGSQAVY